jgi:hypothetical protein
MPHPTPLQGVVVLQTQCRTCNTLQRHTLAGVATRQGAEGRSPEAARTNLPLVISPTARPPLGLAVRKPILRSLVAGEARLSPSWSNDSKAAANWHVVTCLRRI